MESDLGVLGHGDPRSIEGKLAAARRLHDLWGKSLRAEARVGPAIDNLVVHAAAVAGQMAAMDMGERCRRCASRPNGGCCSASMAGESDELQLLLNLLAGVELRLVAHGDDSCPFLDAEGCQFLFKPMFCLNYLCQGIRHQAEAASLHQLEVLTGTLLQGQYALEQDVLDCFRRGRRG